MNAHTPGPWQILGSAQSDKATDWAIGVEKEGKRHIFAEAYGRSDWEHEWPSADNARLIAAAPETAAERDRLREVNAELLEALQAARKDLETFEREMTGIAPEARAPSLLLIRAVIAKAVQS